MREKESDEKKVLLESWEKTLADLHRCRTNSTTEKKTEKINFLRENNPWLSTVSQTSFGDEPRFNSELYYCKQKWITCFKSTF